MALQPAEFVHDGLRLLGWSLAGEETYVVAPELNLAFDLGRAPREVVAVDHIFLTHGHMDHSAGLAYYFAQRMFVDNLPGHLYLPRSLLEPAQRLLRAWADIDGHEAPANLHPVQPGNDVILRRDLIVRPFEVNHPCWRHDGSVIPALGYAAIEVRNKLLPQYQDLTGPELVELKKRGIQITRRLELPLLAYCGDTAPGPFLDLEYVRNAKILLLECTFVESDHRERARAGNHFHVSDLPQVLPRLNNEKVLLTHLSRRSSLTLARNILRKELPVAWAERVSFLMEHRARPGRRS